MQHTDCGTMTEDKDVFKVVCHQALNSVANFQVWNKNKNYIHQYQEYTGCDTVSAYAGQG